MDKMPDSLLIVRQHPTHGAQEDGAHTHGCEAAAVTQMFAGT